MKHIIGDFQSAFIPRRSINDNCVLAHEMLNYIKRREKKNANYDFILNLDLNNAYDCISWTFVEKVVKRIGLPGSWFHLIMQCITMVTYSILINGEPTGRIVPNKENKRQVDPLSPCTFIMCTETLSRNLILQQQQGIIKGLKIAINAPQVSHMLFADDALFFMKGTMDNCWHLRT